MSISFYKTIRYEYFENNSDVLVVILPPAHAIPTDFSLLTDYISLTKRYDVINVLDGYFGIGESSFKSQLDQFNRKAFLLAFCELLESLGYKKVILIAESVGCLHAIDIYNKIPQVIQKVFLSNPAFYKDNFFTKYLYLLLVNVYLLMPNTKLSRFIVNSLMKTKKTGLHALAKYINTVKNVTGKKSFMLCLKEIVMFTKYNREQIIKTLTQNSIVFIGKRDPYFKGLCDFDLCNTHARVVYVDASHTLLKKFPTELQTELSII